MGSRQLRFQLLLLLLAGCSLRAGGLSQQPILLVLSLDGFRYDYLSRANLTHFDQLRTQWTFVPHVQPVFPSKTYPNHISIATGLYSESHGVIGPFVEPETGRLVDHNETEFWNYSDAVQPIWALNEATSPDRFSGCMMWPGCSFLKPPTYVQTYNSSIAWEDQVSMVFDWLRDTERPANLVFWYLDQPDSAGHEYGPDSPQVSAQLRRADRLLGYIGRTLRLFELEKRVNLVVTSDHGMAPVPADHLINLDTVVSPEWYTTLGPDPVLRVLPVTGKSLAVYGLLRDGSEKLGLNYTVYLKEKIPERWHYANNPRVTDILLVADLGYMFTTASFNRTLEYYRQMGRNGTGPYGDHGYDPASPLMDHPLLARGPAFRRQFVHTTRMENVDVAWLAALVLRLPLADDALNGSRLRVQPLLAPDSAAFWAGGAGAGFWTAVVLSVVFGSCVVALVIAVIKRSVRRQSVNSSLINGYMFRYSPVHRVHSRADRVSAAVGHGGIDGEEAEHLLSESTPPPTGV
ncbi:bis(5'-adenosyl)-triphosphatase ENPP4-like [Amphibalanus amphitrite]|uniref:bis(5'-adenosyl)-triphosphatase ENPP4-like n=1 Tax=Amphibalanus amphitrite TaxID=1232801 RepID=UPI001C91F3FA|nr:bis(5'-adenosyl)-triphosphatase ENPP4-like [Amphibalanus amphitrite]XP_043220522.1 bis(5'-adenosyl)-triphosphatase ENPP4-like [Amphibalanus amphitrite]